MDCDMRRLGYEEKSTSPSLCVRNSCPACGEKASRTLHSTPYTHEGLRRFLFSYYKNVDPAKISQRLAGGDFTVLECGDCGLFYQRMIPDPSLSTEIYDEWIIEGDYLEPSAAQLPTSHHAYIASEVMQLLTLQRQRLGRQRLRVLDFGMGWGQWLQIARGLGATVFGMELSEAKRGHAKAIGIPLVDWNDLDQEQFDIIATEQVLEHVADPISIVTRLVKSLDDNGLIKLSVPNAEGIRPRIAGWSWDNDWARGHELMPIHPLEHLNCFSPRSLDRFGEQFGLKRVGVPLRIAYAHCFGSDSPKAILRNLARPVYRYWLRRGGYALFSKR